MPNNLMNEEVFHKVKRASTFKSISNDFDGLERLLLDEICKNGQVDMNGFCNIVDLVVYLPQIRDKASLGNQSPNMYMVLHSNQPKPPDT